MSAARRVFLGLFLVLVAPGVSFVVGACSGEDDSTASPEPVGDASTRRPPAALEAAAEEDGGVESGVRPPPTLPGCIGQSVPLLASGERAYVGIDLGADGGPIVGNFLVDFGANGSTIDFGGFVPDKPMPTGCLGDAATPGAICSFANFDFFGPWGTVSLVTANYSFLFNSIRQAGIIGTDFLSVHAFTLDFHGKRLWKAEAKSFCTDAQMLASGFSPLPSSGFYTNDSKTLRPLSEVISDADADISRFTVPNVPTVPIAIAGVSALAQLDTGYDDRLYRHSININEALRDRLLTAVPGRLTRRPALDLYLTTCVGGLSQRGEAYELADDTPVDFLAEGGGIGRHDVGTMLYVKDRLPEAERCGGVETWTVPAAQMGASFLVDALAVVFDPARSRVWLPKD